MTLSPYVSDRAHVAVAQELIDIYGPLARSEAVARADHSRAQENVIHFCKWREIARLIDMFTDAPPGVTRH